MSFVLSQRQGWSPDDLEPVVLGPFPALRDGVSGSGSSANHAGDPEQTAHAAEFFMWEHFTTKPEFDDRTAEQAGRSHPTLKKIGEIFTPWPSWLIAASTTTFPQPDTDDRLSALFGLLDAGIAEFNAQPDRVVDLLASGAFGCQYTPDDAREWMETVRFVQGGTRGLSRDIVEQTVAVLKVAGVIPSDLPVDRAVELVTGISR
ncbi:hypothetical protein VTN31DRAFT_5037 [Thermomyces dupontii]|uniref:uncharacterized protein n=1 Tax=Talaromyces thermophilus TaxID=28565 RepID=UPI003744754D